MKTEIRPGEYVLATKYSDGDPQDAWCIGFYREAYNHFGEPRHIVEDEHGQSFRHNGYRRVGRLTVKRGAAIVKNKKWIERAGLSMWHWARRRIEDDPDFK